jgi:hypothetical protein
MPKYQLNYTRDGIDFTVIQRTGSICLLEGTYQRTPDLHTYEVHRLRMKKAHPDSADAGQLILCSPSESEWGRYAWTYLTLAAAQEQFDTLANQAGGIAA